MKDKALVCITGQKRAGKDTLANLFVTHGKAKRVALAGAMKSFACRMLDIDLETLEQLKVLEQTRLSPFSNKLVTMRTFLQELGQGMKDVTGDDLIWCKILANKLDLKNEEYVISDVRFPFEEQFFRGLAEVADIDFMAIRVERDGLNNDDPHTSEQHINDVRVDAVIMNDGTIEDLELKLTDAINKHIEKLIENETTAKDY